MSHLDTRSRAQIWIRGLKGQQVTTHVAPAGAGPSCQHWCSYLVLPPAPSPGPGDPDVGSNSTPGSHAHWGMVQSRRGLRPPQQEGYRRTVKSEGPRMLACFPLLWCSAIISSERDALCFLHLSSEEGPGPSEVWRLLTDPAWGSVIISCHLFLLKLCTSD